jgi:hypothetical protein
MNKNMRSRSGKFYLKLLNKNCYLSVEVDVYVFLFIVYWNICGINKPIPWNTYTSNILHCE